MKHLTDGERDILREQEQDARPDAYEALQISYEELAERYDTALDTIVELCGLLAGRDMWLNAAETIERYAATFGPLSTLEHAS